MRASCSSVVLWIACLLCAVPSLLSAQTEPHAFQLAGDYQGTHDPSIIQEGKTYYVFATGAAFSPEASTPSPADATASPAARPAIVGQLPIRCSQDLIHWKRCGQVFSAIPDWIQKKSPRTKELWAPDISYFDGLYHLYYAYSVFGKNTSGIALATSPTLDNSSPSYKWEDRGLVLESTAQSDYNAIDPNLALDEGGGAWLAFGSFWSGIKMRRLDPATGKLSSADTTTYSLASRKKPEGEPLASPGLPPDSQAIEAPFILHHAGYYYLFVSWDLCCRGTKSTYRGMVGRSRKITGPYVDENGIAMLKGGGKAVLTANSAWVGPGGQSLLKLPHREIIVFHAYDAHSGRPALQISTLAWRSGWPMAVLNGGDENRLP